MGSTRRDERRLATVRLAHSVVFWVELGSILWLVLTGVVSRRDRSVALAAMLVAAEGAVWIGNDRVCPLTPLAERYGASSGSVSDIFLPDVMARTIPYWTIPLVILAAVLHLRGGFAGRSWRSVARTLTTPPIGRYVTATIAAVWSPSSLTEARGASHRRTP